MNIRLNQEKMEVIISKPWGGIEIMSYVDFYASNFVMQHLSYNGQ